jgi:hypothetical protein
VFEVQATHDWPEDEITVRVLSLAGRPVDSKEGVRMSLFRRELVFPAREVIEQIGLQLQDHPHARQAAAAVFQQCYRDGGSNDFFSVTVSEDSELSAISVTVKLTGEPTPASVDVRQQLPPTPEQAEQLQRDFEKANPGPRLTDAQLQEIADRVAANRAQDGPEPGDGLLVRLKNFLIGGGSVDQIPVEDLALLSDGERAELVGVQSTSQVGGA